MERRMSQEARDAELIERGRQMQREDFTLADFHKPFPVSTRVKARGEYELQGRLSLNTEHVRHHRDFWEGREGNECESEECEATAELAEGTHRPFAICPHSQRWRYEEGVDGVSASDEGTQMDSSSSPHDRMICGHKDKTAGLNLMYTLCESEEEESGKGEADGGDGKPAYSRRGCPPCSPVGEMPVIRYPGLMGIYMYTFPNGKRYVGQSVNIQERWWSTVKDARAGVLQFPVLRAIRKYGWENVTKEILLFCPQHALDFWEIAMVDAWDSLTEDLGGTGYNAIPAGQERRGRQIGRSVARSNTWARNRELHGDEWEEKRVDSLRRKYEEKGWDEEKIATKMENARRAKETRLEKYAGTHTDGRLQTSERRNSTWLARQEAHAATLSPVSRERYWRKVGSRKRAKAKARAKRKAERAGNLRLNSYANEISSS